MKNILCILLYSCGILGHILLGETAEALERMPVERLDLQAKLLRVVIKFSTRRLNRMVVGIVYVPETKQIAQKFATEIEKLTYNEQPVKTVFIKAEELQSIDDSVNVLYVTPGNKAFLDSIFEITVKKKLFSCTGVPEYVRDNKIALGFDEYRGKSQILLNLAVVKSTDHDFKNPKFLNLQATRKLILIK